MDFLHSIDNILTNEQCQKYIDLFNDPSKVEHINDKHRKYHRVQFQDKELAGQLYEKVKNGGFNHTVV